MEGTPILSKKKGWYLHNILPVLCCGFLCTVEWKLSKQRWNMRGGITCANSVARVDAVRLFLLFLLFTDFSLVYQKKKVL